MTGADEPSLEDLRHLQEHAWAVIEGLRDTGIDATDAFFVLMLALARFVSVLPVEHRQDTIEQLQHYLGALVPEAVSCSRPRFDT